MGMIILCVAFIVFIIFFLWRKRYAVNRVRYTKKESVMTEKKKAIIWSVAALCSSCLMVGIVGFYLFEPRVLFTNNYHPLEVYYRIWHNGVRKEVSFSDGMIVTFDRIIEQNEKLREWADSHGVRYNNEDIITENN